MLSPDGQHIAFVGDLTGKPQRSYSQPDLFITGVDAGGTPKNLTTAYDFDIGGGIGGDQAPPRGGGRSQPFWSGDGRFIYIVAAEEGRANLKQVDAETGKVYAAHNRRSGRGIVHGNAGRFPGGGLDLYSDEYRRCFATECHVGSDSSTDPCQR